MIDMENDRRVVLTCLADLYSDSDLIENKEVRNIIEISLDSLKEHFQIADKEIKEVQSNL